MLDLALKEWAVICDLLLEGKLAFVLRKGGIHEEEGPGRFTLVHQKFLLFPSWLHQKPDALKPAYRSRVTVFGQEPSQISFAGMAEARQIWKINQRSVLDPLDDLHPWATEQLDMRWNYKQENPLYLIALRVHRLATPKIIANTPAYGGCKSWVPLAPSDAVKEEKATPVMSEEAFTQTMNRLTKVLATDG